MSEPITLDISEIIGQFPTFRVALVVARGLKLSAERTSAVSDFVVECETQAAAAMAGLELADMPELKVWREAYKAFGVKKTSYRSSVERLLKSVQRGMALPRINTLVDLYNAISVRHRLPIGADDLDLIEAPLAFRLARTTDSFVALGDTSVAIDPPRQGEVVYADAKKCLCRRWNWYQDARSACSVETRQAVLTIQSLGPVFGGGIEDVAHALCGLIAEDCGGQAAFVVADRGKMTVSVT